jgi:hypothetical protein
VNVLIMAAIMIAAFGIGGGEMHALELASWAVTGGGTA